MVGLVRLPLGEVRVVALVEPERGVGLGLVGGVGLVDRAHVEHVAPPAAGRAGRSRVQALGVEVRLQRGAVHELGVGDGEGSEVGVDDVVAVLGVVLREVPHERPPLGRVVRDPVLVGYGRGRPVVVPADRGEPVVHPERRAVRRGHLGVVHPYGGPRCAPRTASPRWSAAGVPTRHGAGPSPSSPVITGQLHPGQAVPPVTASAGAEACAAPFCSCGPCVSNQSMPCDIGRRPWASSLRMTSRSVMTADAHDPAELDPVDLPEADGAQRNPAHPGHVPPPADRRRS